MLIKVVVVISTIIMIYALLRCRKCMSLIPQSDFSIYWNGIAGLITLFIAAYTIYLGLLFTNIELSSERLLIGFLLFSGSIFVLLVTILSYLAFSEILGLQQETQSYAECLEDEIRKRTQKLEELTMTDALTGLYNQRSFFGKLDEEIARSSRQRTFLYLLVFDVDKLKRYNDTHGRFAGDHLLQTVGLIVRQNIRDKIDSGFRYGGDRFAVILPNASNDQAFDVAKRIIIALNSHNIFISAGLVPFSGHNSLDAKDLTKIADIAMGQAKLEGGNRIKIFQPQSPEEGKTRRLG